jgi:hypothetical protein
LEDLKGRDHLKDIGIDGRILKSILKKYNGPMHVKEPRNYGL